MANNPTVRFRHLDVGKCLYETLRAYYSVNSAGKVNWLYKYCACLLQPLVGPLQQYEAERVINGLIANSKFQVGQLTNVLNYLYDNVLNRIFITQAGNGQTVARNFNEQPILFARNFGELPIAFARNFNEPQFFVNAVIHVPYSANLSQLTATVAQMALEGLSYTIITF
jgi:hypothetical protein